MKIGSLINKARKRAKMKLEDLGHAVGLSMSSMSAYENNKLKGSIDPDVLVKIADTLNDLSILVHHCESCPVRKHIFIKQFPDLNNIRHDPAIISGRLGKELQEAVTAAADLGEQFSNKDFKDRPDYKEIFGKAMEQVIDVKRCIEIFEFELILSGTHSSKDLQRVYDKQQKKCEERGHHKPEGAV